MTRSNGIVTESVKKVTKEYRDNYDKIFNKEKPKCSDASKKEEKEKNQKQ